MCEKTVEKSPCQLVDFSGRFKTKKMCQKAVEDESEALELEYVPNRFKTEVISEKAFKDNPWSLTYVPNQKNV